MSLISYQYLSNRANFPNLPYLSGTTPNKYSTPIKIGDIEIIVEVVNTPESRAKGLSDRKSLCNNCGMLFDFGVEDTIPGFWMKDMLIPIDIIWINDGSIVGIENNVHPEPGKRDAELTKYSPSGSIDYVLEVNAGFSKNNDVTKETKVDIIQF